MMPYIRILIGLLLFNQSLAANAAREVGNGGLVVYCTDFNGVRISSELLDFQESRTLLNLPVRDDLRVLPMDAFIRETLKALFRLDPERAVRFSKWNTEFSSESTFLSDIELLDTNDFDSIAIPTGCSLKQAAIQRIPLFPEEKRYYFSKSVWENLTDTDRAGLKLHEFVYRDAIAAGQTNSRRTRLYMGYLTSSLLPNSNQIDYDDRLSRISLKPRLLLNSPWITFDHPDLWRMVSDRVRSGGQSTIQVGVSSVGNSNLALNLRGSLSRLESQTEGFVGFAAAYSQVMTQQQVSEGAKTRFEEFSFKVCGSGSSMASDRVNVGTFSIRPSSQLIQRLSIDFTPEELRTLTLQYSFDLPSSSDSCNDIKIKMEEFELSVRGRNLGRYQQGSIDLDDMKEIGFGVIRSKQILNEQLAPSILEFAFSVRDFAAN